MTPTYTIRVLSPHDAGAYVELRREMLLDSPWAFAASPGSDMGSNEVHVAEQLGRGPEGKYAIIGAFEPGAGDAGDARLVAAAGLIGSQRPKMAHRADVWGVYVTPAWRGRGVGEAVMRGVMATARTWPGVTGLRLSVSVRSVGAARLYERLGFRRWGVEPGALILDGVAYDEIHMVAEL